MPDEYSPWRVGWDSGVSCGTANSIVEYTSNDNVAKTNIPWDGIVAGTNITITDSTPTGVTINSAGGGGSGDVESIIAGVGLTGLNLGGPDVTLNVDDASGTASGINIPGEDGVSSVEVSSTGDSADDNDILVFDAGAAKAKWVAQPWIFNESTGSMQSNTNALIIEIAADSTLSGANFDIISRNVFVGNSLSAHPDSTTQLDGAVHMANSVGVSGNFTVSNATVSSITVSSCPVPSPWSFVEVTADDGENTADAYYFASGSTQSTTEIDAAHITWNSTAHYFTIANAGYYEFEMQGSVIVGSSPTTVTTSILQTAGLGGSEIEKIDKAQVIRTNIDPHDIMIKWVGYVGAGINFTCKIDGTAAVVMQKGSTFTCKRIN